MNKNIIRYIHGLEIGDLEVLADVLSLAEDDLELGELIRQVHEVYIDELGEAKTHPGECV